MGVASYIKDIVDTVKSTFEGMSITFSHLARRPMTIQYPDKIPVPIQETLPRRYRGIRDAPPAERPARARPDSPVFRLIDTAMNPLRAMCSSRNA